MTRALEIIRSMHLKDIAAGVGFALAFFIVAAAASAVLP
jgi:hypothetical protein